jgi:hypothetical protein
MNPNKFENLTEVGQWMMDDKEVRPTRWSWGGGGAMDEHKEIGQWMNTWMNGEVMDLMVLELGWTH